jgi:tetratricopeptide (TPR) repeat protein
VVASTRRGRIVTFYSYKGGVGRSLMVANLAFVLASNGRRVAVIDWDLEAPGLHRYFAPFLTDQELTATSGIVDLLTGYWDALVQQPADGSGGTGWVERFLDVTRYSVTLALPDTVRPGQISFIPAGRQTAAYATKVGNFDWDAFYNDAGGRGFLDALRERLAADFDDVLIDSRTGVSDTAGVCTVHMPDDLVVCFAYNNQNIRGSLGIATSVAGATRQPRVLLDGTSCPTAPVAIFPVPTRVDRFSAEQLQPRRKIAWAAFAPVLSADLAGDGDQYWLDVEQPYVPGQSYVETLSFLVDKPGDHSSLLGAVERVATRVTNGAVKRWIPMFSNEMLESLRASSDAGLPRPESAASIVVPTSAGAVGSTIDLDRYWPLFCRFIEPTTTEPAAVRNVPFRTVAHLRDQVESQLNLANLTIRIGPGGESSLSLSLLGRPHIGELLARARADRPTLTSLWAVEQAAARWQGAAGDSRTTLMSGKALRQNKRALANLRRARLLSASEEFFLSMSEQAAERIRSLQRRVILVVTVGALIGGLASFAYTAWSSSSEAMEDAKASRALSAQLQRDTRNTLQRFDAETAKLNDQLKVANEELATLKAKQDDDGRRFLVYYGDGHHNYEKGLYQDAIASFTQAVEVGPQDNFDVYWWRATSRQRLLPSAKTDSEREELLKRVLEDFVVWAKLSEQVDRHIQVAVTLDKYGRRQEALAELQQAAVAPKPGQLSRSDLTRAARVLDDLKKENIDPRAIEEVRRNLTERMQATSK